MSIFAFKKTELERRIGYRFKNRDLLALALTHSSLRNEDDYLDDIDSNERLEFLGDAVLQLISAEELFRRFPIADEGELTEMRRVLVNGKFLAQKARDIGLGDALKMSVGEHESGGRRKTSILADAYEALLGAIFLDGGIDSARKFIERNHLIDIDEHLESDSHVNFKGMLLERMQARGKQPEYRTLDSSGPDHKRTFEVAVFGEGREIGRGKGPSKKAAEKAAARDAVEKLNKSKEHND